MNEDICYWCGELATSREHVPPKCLFPENKDVKDIYSQSFRNNLITVPSCDKHNMKKSHDDEYLMACLSGRVGNNGVAYIHNATKVKRARIRNPKIIKVDKGDILHVKGQQFPVQLITIDNYRLMHSFEAIARGLYFYQYHKRFLGECTFVSHIFINADNNKGTTYILRAIELIEKEQPSWGTKI
ncbi:MAG: hypothetical protein N4A50_14810, partial [Vallitalea sp.]|nr:hypothetical protein [Vallitalea sp.]